MTIGIAVAGYYETSDTVGIETNVPVITQYSLA